MKSSLSREDRFGYQADFVVARWNPWVRWSAGSIGLLALSQGLQRRGPLPGAFALAGALLLARAITNLDITSLVGAVVLPVMRMTRTLKVDAPVDDVFDFWKDFTNYPRFMSFIEEVGINESAGLRWVAIAPGGTRIHWDTTLLDLQQNQRIAWKSVPGSIIATEGTVQMEPTDEGDTLLRVGLSYALPFGAAGYASAMVLGFDPRSRIDQDLARMKELIETRSRERMPTEYHKGIA